MKIGSIVEFIGTNGMKLSPGVECEMFPYKNKPYTVAEVIDGPYCIFIKLDEFRFNTNVCQDDFMSALVFREIQFPPNLEEEIQTALTAPQPVEICNPS